MAVLEEHDIEQRLAGLPAWRRGEDPATIVSERQLANFATAVEHVNRVAELAETANHHPDILLHGWNKVRLTLSTHSDGGLTAADFDLAGQIEGLP